MAQLRLQLGTALVEPFPSGGRLSGPNRSWRNRALREAAPEGLRWPDHRLLVHALVSIPGTDRAPAHAMDPLR